MLPGRWFFLEEAFPALMYKENKMNCDVCGNDVQKNENATHLEAIVNESPLTVFISGSRHILCSPSRAQYIVHESFVPVVDDRQAYDKRLLPEYMRTRKEKKWTNAWVELVDEEV